MGEHIGENAGIQYQYCTNRDREKHSGIKPTYKFGANCDQSEIWMILVHMSLRFNPGPGVEKSVCEMCCLKDIQLAPSFHIKIADIL